MIIPTFLKWAGGKRRILPIIESYFPSKIQRYFEPFLGGGSVFFYVKQKYQPSYSMISDANEDLINVYINVRDNPNKLIKYLKDFKNKNSEKFYYLTRAKFNKKKVKGIKRSAAFIYLNKTCFNGLYRVNLKNEFNVPYGQFLNPGIFEDSVIKLASKLLRDNVDIKCCDYRDIASHTRKDDLVYLDPCYDPLKKTSFTQYTPTKFSEIDRNKLFEFIGKLTKKRARAILSNNDIPEVRKIYNEYQVDEVKVARFINSQGNGRGAVTELIIRNYK